MHFILLMLVHRKIQDLGISVCGAAHPCKVYVYKKFTMYAQKGDIVQIKTILKRFTSDKVL